MFEAAVKRITDRYNNNNWYIKDYSIEQQKIELINAVKEEMDIPSAYVLIYKAINHPIDYKEVYDCLEDFPLLKKCIEFIKQENISLDVFSILLEKENRDKFCQEATELLDTIIAKELEPYFTLIFETVPTRRKRANALFKEN